MAAINRARRSERPTLRPLSSYGVIDNTISLPRLRPAVAIDPVAPRCSSGAPPTGFAKKNSGDAASRACGKRKPMQADALSDADSMHWRFFGSRGRPKSPCVKPAPFQMQIQCTRDHHRGCGRRRPLGPASGQHRQCITQKNPARPSAPTRHTRHTRQRIKTPMCRLGIRSEQTSETRQSYNRNRNGK